jgi:biopolymer transport protein ExbD
VKLRVDRQAKVAHVAEMMRALTEGGASSVTVQTDTRTEFPKTVTFTALGALMSKPTCSVVAKVLTERRNAVWSLSGGTAVKSPKGLAGPDMAMTQDNLTNAARRCKDSDVVFVSGDEDVEWGLIYDLSAATKVLEKVTFAKVVLLEPGPVAGRPVKLD